MSFDYDSLTKEEQEEYCDEFPGMETTMLESEISKILCADGDRFRSCYNLSNLIYKCLRKKFGDSYDWKTDNTDHVVSHCIKYYLDDRPPKKRRCWMDNDSDSDSDDSERDSDDSDRDSDDNDDDRRQKKDKYDCAKQYERDYYSCFGDGLYDDDRFGFDSDTLDGPRDRDEEKALRKKYGDGVKKRKRAINDIVDDDAMDFNDANYQDLFDLMEKKSQERVNFTVEIKDEQSNKCKSSCGNNIQDNTDMKSASVKKDNHEPSVIDLVDDDDN